MDSRPETYCHIQVVQEIMLKGIARLNTRLLVHDRSKLISPELEYFDKFTPLLATTVYGSPEYKECLEGMRPALEHHYAHNSHHPQHYARGCTGMTLLDLFEMLSDWKAATKRNPGGDIRQSIRMNQKRFGYSDELMQILLNTLDEIT